ncbi:cytochrome P450 [Lenzites betulinus]|nr:cytochrome P450 [Lenzites betulinus]
MALAVLEDIDLPQAALTVVCLYLVAWRLKGLFSFKNTLKNVPGPPSISRITGNINQLMARDSLEWRNKLRDTYGRTTVLHGLLNQREWVYTHDPKALQYIFAKDQDAYEEPVTGMCLMLGPGLLGTAGEQHRRQRKMLNPVFSTKHLRNMTPLFYEIVHKTRDAIMTRVQAGAEKGAATVEIEMLSWMGRTTLEIIGQAGLGHSFDPLIEDVQNEFAKTVKDFFPQMRKSSAMRLLLPYVAHIGPAAFRRWVLELIPTPIVQRMVEISDIMHARSLLIFNEKKAALERGDEAMKLQVGEGRDVMSILLRANTLASAEDKLPDEEIIGQVSTMILAGMDTAANTLARILLLLAENPDVQERLRAEIVTAVEAEGHGDTLDYDPLMALPYLDAVCRETFRAFPGVNLDYRETTRETVLPLATPVTGLDGELVTAIPLRKGQRVIIDVVASNTDSALWGPDARQWRPDRWMEGPVPKEVEQARLPGVFSNMMTFLAGNRSCIGFNFAQLEIKAVLLVLLQWFKFEPTGDPIAWNFATVEYPTVGRESIIPALPLKVSRLHPQ